MASRFGAGRSGTIAVLFMALLGLGVVCAQSGYAETHIGRCDPALTAAQRVANASAPEGRARIATALARAAFEALEPAYPAQHGSQDWNDPNAAWLDARGLLPPGWSDDVVRPDAWRELMARLQRPYGREPVAVSGADDPATLRTDVEAALAAGVGAIRPLALIGTERTAEGGRAVAFGTVIWNWTPRPRLLAFRVAGASIGEAGAEGLLPRLGTCAWTPRSWASAPADLARDVYVGSPGAGVTILALPGDDAPGEILVDDADAEAVFRLEAPALEGVPYASLGFAGPGPTVSTVLRLVFSLQTNVGLFDLGTYLTIP